MVNNRRIVYSDNRKITSLAMQPEAPYLWTAFAINSSGRCIIEKQFAFDPSQTFYTLERVVDNIPKMVCDADQLYVAYDDPDLIGEIISVDNPLTITVPLEMPSGVSAGEAPVDVQVHESNVWFLLPGAVSGTTAKLIRFDTDGDYEETIELDNSGSEVTDASSMAIDDNGDIWIVTHTDPSTIVRVFELSGGGWDYQITVIE